MPMFVPKVEGGIVGWFEGMLRAFVVLVGYWVTVLLIFMGTMSVEGCEIGPCASGDGACEPRQELEDETRSEERRRLGQVLVPMP